METTSSTKASTGSNIVKTLGSGSGIDTNALITNLVDINKAPQAEKLTAKKTLLETQISDFGLFRSHFSKLETAISALSNADTFNAKSASIPTTSLLGITKLDASASVGEFAITVDAVAKSQSLASGDFTSQTAPIGKGTIAIRFGSWDHPATTFTVDASKTGGSITVNDSNNSLVGLRDTINKSGLGVKASILTVDGKFKLMVTAPSGASNEVELTVTEDSGAPGLSEFNFNNTTRKFSEKQPGENSEVHVNGMQIIRPTNHLTDVIEGLEFDIFNKSATETVSVGISEDRSLAEKAIRDFVSAYNTFLTDSKKLTGYDEEKKEFGSLKQDPLAKNIMQQLRAQLNSAVTGLSSTFTTLANLGIRTELDGTLTIDDDTKTKTSFKSALADNFEAIRDFFIPVKKSSNAQISVSKYTDKSTPGNYDVTITTQPTKGGLIGGVVNNSWNLDNTGKPMSFVVTLDGTESNTITLPTKTYGSMTAVAAEMQSLINADSKISGAKLGVSVSYNTTSQKFEFSSNAFGSSSKVTLSSVSTDATSELGLINAVGSTGTDVAGTVGGQAGFGFGNILLPALGSKAEGLSLTVEPGATSGSISFSRGFASSLTNLMDSFLKTNGSIKVREDNINNEIKKVKVDQTNLDRRSESYRRRLQAQFGAMEGIVRSLKSTGTFLTGAFKALSGSSDS